MYGDSAIMANLIGVMDIGKFVFLVSAYLILNKIKDMGGKDA